MSRIEHRDSNGVKGFQRLVGLFVLFLVLGGVVHSGFGPSYEMEELLGFCIEGPSVADTSLNKSTIYVASSHHGPDGPVNSEGDDDDCLCWCGQVLPGEFFEMASPSQEFALYHPENAFLPSAPPRLLFHPPRLA